MPRAAIGCPGQTGLMSRPRPQWLYAIAAVTVLWLSLGLAFAIALGREHGNTDCHVIDSTYGKRHWQWSPPGTYCIYSGPVTLRQNGARPSSDAMSFSVARAGWDRPPQSRTLLAELLIASGVVIGFAWFLRWLKVRAPS